MKIFCHLSLWSGVVILTHISIIEAILPQCTFTGTSGFCAGMSGPFIRPEHDHNVRAFYIVNCDLTALTSEDFSRFQSLSTLHINNCTLPRTADRSLLSDLKELKDLQITHSNISNDIKYMFVNNTGLNNLSLQSNRITQIRRDTFSHLNELHMLDVSNNDISEIDQDAFSNLIHLQKLVLSKNKIGENFNPESLSLPSGQCGVCGGKCPVNASTNCKENEEADHLWRAFKERYGTTHSSPLIFLQDNPICSKLVKADNWWEKTKKTEAPTDPPSPGCALLHGEECEDRRTFFNAVCTETRGPSDSDHAEDLPSGPEVEEAPESAPEVDVGADNPVNPSSEESPGAGAGTAEGSGQRDPSAHGVEKPAAEEPSSVVVRDPDGDDDYDANDADNDDDKDGDDADNDDDKDGDDADNDDDNAADAGDAANDDGVDESLPPSSVEVEEIHNEGLSQLSSHSVLLGAIGGFVAAPMVGGALFVFFRSKRPYRSIQQDDQELKEISIIKINQAEAHSSTETIPLTPTPTQ